MMYTCDYLRLTEIFELLAYTFLFVLCVGFYCNDPVIHGSR